MFKFLKKRSDTLPSCHVDSSEWPDDVSVTLDVPYLPGGHPKHHLDVYAPAAPHDELLPVVVFVHGGGWMRGCRRWTTSPIYDHMYMNVAFALVRSMQCVVVVPSYRLSRWEWAQIHNMCKWSAIHTTWVLGVVVAAVSWILGHFGFGVDGGIFSEFVVSLTRDIGNLACLLLCVFDICYLVLVAMLGRLGREGERGLKHPTHAMDVAAALEWTQDAKTMAEYGGDSTRISTVAHSAGGHIVSYILLNQRFQRAQGLSRRMMGHIRAHIGICGIYNFGRMRKQWWGTQYFYLPGFHDTRAAMIEQSPLTYVHKTPFPWYVLNAGAFDFTLRRDGYEFTYFMRRNGNLVIHEVVPAPINHQTVISLVGDPDEDPITSLMAVFLTESWEFGKFGLARGSVCEAFTARDRKDGRWKI